MARAAGDVPGRIRSNAQRWTERCDKAVGSASQVRRPIVPLCFSEEEPGTQGPRRVSKREMHDAFAEGWSVESIEPSRYEVRPDLKDLQFSEGGPKAWFVMVRRAA